MAMTVTRGSVLAVAGDRIAGVILRGRLRRHETRLTRVLAIASIGVLLAMHWAAVTMTGGAPGPLHHLAYPPILWAAYLFGVRGALVAAGVSVLVSGPVPVLVPHDVSTDVSRPDALVRAVVFVGVALATGILFARLRTALDGWRTTAVRVAQREREGMVALARGAEAKDTDTGDHIRRVQAVSERLAIATSLDAATAEALGWAAMLHDVGKLHVPDRILQKPGPLTEAERAIVRMHPLWGAQILADGDGFEVARRVARWHHEDFDGSGYPDGLRGERIPLEARIVRVADALDAMTHDRPYQAARSLEWALDELRRCAGRQFDPEIVRLFLDLVATDAAFSAALTSAARVTRSPESGPGSAEHWLHGAGAG
jgi:putative two-component system response regulator